MRAGARTTEPELPEIQIKVEKKSVNSSPFWPCSSLTPIQPPLPHHIYTPLSQIQSRHAAVLETQTSPFEKSPER